MHASRSSTFYFRRWGLLVIALLLGHATAPKAFTADDAPADLVSLQKSVRHVIQEATDWTVCIMSGPGMGSGVIISDDGYVLTAAHVMGGAQTEDDIVIVLNTGRRVRAMPLGANRTRDAALVKIVDPMDPQDPDRPWPHAKLGNSAKLKLGDWIVSLGHPGGYEPGRLPPARLGRIVANEDGPFGLITDSTLIGGDSGGPMFNLKGEVVGIHSSIGAPLSENRHVPVDVYKRDWTRLKDADRWGRLGQLVRGPDAGYLGVGIELTDGGVKVTDVREDSAAEKGGVQPGDVVQSIEGFRVGNPFSLVETVSARRPGDTVKLKVKRGGEDLTLDVELGVREED